MSEREIALNFLLDRLAHELAALKSFANSFREALFAREIQCTCDTKMQLFLICNFLFIKMLH